MVNGLEMTEALLKASNREELAIRCRLHHCERVADKAVDLLLLETQKNDTSWSNNDIELYRNACQMHDCVKYLVSTKEHGVPASELFQVIYKDVESVHFDNIKMALHSHSRKELSQAMSGDDFIPLRCLMLADTIDKIALESILYSYIGLTGNPKDVSSYIIKIRGKIMQYWSKCKNTFDNKKDIDSYISREISLRIRDYANMNMIIVDCNDIVMGAYPKAVGTADSGYLKRCKR